MHRRLLPILLLAAALAGAGAASAAGPRGPELVPGPRDVPGLSPLAGGAAAGRAAVGAALHAGGLPAAAAAAHFRGAGVELWTVAFLLPTPAAASAALRAAAGRAAGAHARRRPVAVGDGGWLLAGPGDAAAVVVWRRGRGLGAVLLGGKLPAAALERTALRYAAQTDSRLSRALSATALDTVLAGIGPRGQISRPTALALLALAYGPFPGTAVPAGARPQPFDGTIAGGAAIRVWQTLTAAQRRSAAQLLGLRGVDLTPQAGRRPAAAAKAPTYGDPAFRRDPRVEAVVRRYVAEIGAKMGIGRPLRLQIVAGASTGVRKATANSATHVRAGGTVLPAATVDNDTGGGGTVELRVERLHGWVFAHTYRTTVWSGRASLAWRAPAGGQWGVQASFLGTATADPSRSSFLVVPVGD